MKPNVSVVMPVFNGEAFVKEALESILNQSFKQFEIVVINDGSTDKTQEIVTRLASKDARIRLINHPKNSGLIPCLNEGLELAQGNYIARMDADDIAHPIRLQRQFEFLESNPQVIVCGSYIRLFGEKSGIKTYPLVNDELKSSLLFFSPLAHPSVMYKKTVIKPIGYQAGFEFAEDFRLWSRLIDKGEFAVVPQTLLSYRTNENQISQTKRQLQMKHSRSVAQYLLEKLPLKLSKNELELHMLTMFPEDMTTKNLEEITKWFSKISAANDERRLFEENACKKVLAKRFFELCINSSENKQEAWDIWHQWDLNYHYSPTPIQKLIMYKQKWS